MIELLPYQEKLLNLITNQNKQHPQYSDLECMVYMLSEGECKEDVEKLEKKGDKR